MSVKLLECLAARTSSGRVGYMATGLFKVAPSPDHFKVSYLSTSCCWSPLGSVVPQLSPVVVILSVLLSLPGYLLVLVFLTVLLPLPIACGWSFLKVLLPQGTSCCWFLLSSIAPGSFPLLISMFFFFFLLPLPLSCCFPVQCSAVQSSCRQDTEQWQRWGADEWQGMGRG